MTTEQNNGGPAFPLQSIGPEFSPGYAGMSLRDYFAAKAMAAFISTSGGPCIVGGLNGAEPKLAEAAYKMADNMLEARK